MIRGLLSSALRAATALKLTPKKYFVFFWGPRGGRQGWDRTPAKICKAKIFWGVLQGSRKNRAASFVGGYLWGPRKDFCEAKRFVGNFQGSRKCFSQKKIFGRRRSKRLNRGVCRKANTRKERLKWGPQKRFAKQRFFGERRNRRYQRGIHLKADARKRRRVPTWCRRPASNRYAFRHRILNPARLPISPRRHIRRPLRDGAQFFCLRTQFSSGPFGSGSPPSAGALSCSASSEVSSVSVAASSAFSTGAGVPSGAAYACVLTVRS